MLASYTFIAHYRTIFTYTLVTGMDYVLVIRYCTYSRDRCCKPGFIFPANERREKKYEMDTGCLGTCFLSDLLSRIERENTHGRARIFKVSGIEIEINLNYSCFFHLRPLSAAMTCFLPVLFFLFLLIIFWSCQYLPRLRSVVLKFLTGYNLFFYYEILIIFLSSATIFS